MNKNSGKGKQAMTYVILLSLLVILAVYYFVFLKMEDKTQTIKISNMEMEKTVSTLKEYYEKEPFYLENIELMKKEILDITDTYEADVKEEDIIMLAVNSLETADIEYTNINIADKASFYSVDSEIVKGANIDELNNQLIFATTESSYVTKASYFHIKDLVSTINSRKGRHTINNLNFTKNNADNILEGTIEMRFYSLLGTNKEYEQVDMNEYVSGLEDLFKLKVITEEETEDDNE